MNRTKHAIVNTFWQLLEEKPYSKITVQDIVDRCHVNRNTFYYHFQDIPSLAELSVEGWTDEIIKKHGVFGSPVSCLTYMAEECTKRKKALLHLYRSAQKEVFLGYLSRMGYHIICFYIENTTGNLTLPESTKENLIRYYKCTFVGILLDWLENGASYDLAAFYQELCELFSGSGERAFLKCAVHQDKH